MTIAFIGLGNMGMPMARNLLKASYTVRAYNRSPEKSESIKTHGAQIFDNPAEAVRDADVVITMLSDDKAVQEISGKIIVAMKKQSVHVSMSTIAPSTARMMSDKFNEAGIRYIAAPVMGRPPAAEAKQLFFLVSGPAEAKSMVQPVFEALGQRVFDYGSDPSAANLVKVMVNFMIFSTVEILSEVMLIAEKGNIDKQFFLEMITSTLFAAPAFKIYGTLIAEEKNITNGFSTRLASKDLRLMQDAASNLGTDMPLAEVVQKHFKEMIGADGSELDISALIGHLRKNLS